MNGGEEVGAQYEEGKMLRVVVKWEVSSGMETGSVGMKGGHRCIIPVHMDRK